MINPFNVEQQNTGTYKETESTVYTNKTGIQAYLADKLIELNESSYGGAHEATTISASMFSKSIKQIILHLNRAENFYKTTVDVSDLIKSVQGSILHEAYLGTEPSRQFITIDGYTISGGADRITYGPNDTPLLKSDDLSILDGQTNIKLRDIKTTSTHVVAKLKAEMQMHKLGTPLADMKVHTPVLFKYVIQQSIYNVLYGLNLTTATLDVICMDWTQANRSTIGEMLQPIDIPLATPADTISFITDIVDKVTKYRKSNYLPDCTPTELGGKPTPVFKLVKDPSKPRAVPKSGQFRSRTEAAMAQVNFPGTVIYDATKPNTPFLCTAYCEFNCATDANGVSVCKQGDSITMQQG